MLYTGEIDNSGSDLAGPGGTPDFAALFRALPSPYIVLDRQLNYVEANDAYCEATERRREELIGRSVFEMFPNEDAGGQRLRESFERVLATGQPDSLPLVAYPIALPRSRAGVFEMRYWSCVHTPLPGPDGRTRFIVQNTVDVTELQRLKHMASGAAPVPPEPGEPALLQRAREVEKVNEALSQEIQSLKDLFKQAPGFMTVLAGPELRVVLVNAAGHQLVGARRPVIDHPIEEALPELVEQGITALMRKAFDEREPVIGVAVSVRLQRSPDAPLEERVLDFVIQPILNAAGETWGVFIEGSDVTARVAAERHQRLLVDELNHRVKNTLASVQAIADQTLRTTPEPAAFRIAFQARLMALSATQDLLTRTGWRSAALADILKQELRPYGPERCRLAGPDVDLAPSQAVTLGLVAHELATNAAKYGGLSASGGEVLVDWSVTDVTGDRWLEIVWRERGGPEVQAPTHRGFGSRLIARSLGPEGWTTLDFAKDGLVCRISLRLAAC
jgi:PAS domain S-box-containing protein